MKRTVLELECSRCHRKEYVPAPEGEPVERTPIVVVIIKGTEVARFEDLCEPCEKAIAGYVEQITKPMEKKSPNRKKKDSAAPPPVQTETNGTGAKEKGHVHPPPAVVTARR